MPVSLSTEVMGSEVVPFFDTPVGKHVLSVEDFPCGLVACIWRQDLPHGNKCKDDGDVCLPILDYGSAESWILGSLPSLWNTYGVVAVRLPESSTCLEQQLQDDWKAMQGKPGACMRVGMFTGGGLPYSKFAVQARATPSFKELFLAILKLDGRYVANVPYVAMEEALVTLPISCLQSYKGLPVHTDNNILENAHEIFHLQGNITLCPPAKGFARTAILAAYMPLTPWIYRSTLVGMSTRSSRSEWGCIGKGPRDRPPPAHIQLASPRPPHFNY